jgi:predicted  nucleic acid-binding Zn-ribbon protein
MATGEQPTPASSCRTCGGRGWKYVTEKMNLRRDGGAVGPSRVRRPCPDCQGVPANADTNEASRDA